MPLHNRPPREFRKDRFNAQAERYHEEELQRRAQAQAEGHDDDQEASQDVIVVAPTVEDDDISMGDAVDAGNTGNTDDASDAGSSHDDDDDVNMADQGEVGDFEYILSGGESGLDSSLGWGSDSEVSDEEDYLVNLDDLRDGNIDAADQAIRAALDLDDVLGAGGYEECINVEPSEPFLDIEDTGRDIQDAETRAAAQPGDEDDISRLIKIRQKKNVDMSPLAIALATYADLTGMSRKLWASLREALQYAYDDSPDNLPRVVQSLPVSLSTLTRNLRDRMPLMDMREADIPLNTEKMPTLPARLKPEERRKLEAMRARKDMAKDAKDAKKEAIRIAREKGRNSQEAKRAAKTAERLHLKAKEQHDGDGDGDGIDVPKSTMKLTFFDPITVFKNLVASDVGHRAHSGPGHFVDEPSELFESHAWLSSVRTTSGQFAHVILQDGTKGPAIFPSDWVYYRCRHGDCPLSCSTDNNVDGSTKQVHIGRVYGVGFDLRTTTGTPAEPSTHTAGEPELCLQIQEAFRRSQIANCTDLVGIDISPAQEPRELILTATITYIPEYMVYAQVEHGVYVDRYFGEVHEDPAPRSTTSKHPVFPKYQTPVFKPPRNEHQFYSVRRMIDKHRCLDELIPMCHTHPIRAEMELEQWGRAIFENEWDKTRGSIPVKSFPHLDFIDGFGVFRNAYRTLMGLYFTPAGLLQKERLRPGSIFPLVLGPHGSNFADVIKGLKTMGDLDAGIVTDINGQQVRLCAFPLCYIGDMPQQAENSGLKGPRGNKFCRCCYTYVGQQGTGGGMDPRIQIDFDIVTHGRYHNQTREMEQMLAGLGGGNPRKLIYKRYGTQWGMNEPHPALVKISPALDLIMTRPLDGAHTEFNGIINLMHFLLRDMILNRRGRAEYASQLSAWPFPPGWESLPSPIHHLDSYSLSDHGRWIIVTPALLLHWLKEEYMQPRFCTQVYAEGDEDPVTLVISAVTALAKSTSLIMGVKVSRDDMRNIDDIIKRGRHLFNRLCLFASASRGSGRSTGAVNSPEPDADVEPAPAPPVVINPDAPDNVVSKKAQYYINATLRPNIHVGVHFPAFAEEYGLPVNCNTLTGEDMHRDFKKRVYETNYSNVEKILLMKANFQETFRLLLGNAFKHEDKDPELTAIIQAMYPKCPTLFGMVLSRSDREEMEMRKEPLRQDFDTNVDLSADNNHLSPATINVIPSTTFTACHAANEGQRLPLKNREGATDTFWKHVRQAYRYSYSKPPFHPVVVDNRIIQWSRKFAFTDRESNDRFTFGPGDYIQYLTRSRKTRFGRVDHVFVMDNLNAVSTLERHIFIIITRIKRTKQRHPILDLEIFEETEEALIIGIPAVLPVCLYMVHVDGVGIVWVNWDVYTM